jgi:uncharacterized membrane protein
MAGRSAWSDQRLEAIVGNILRFGVMAAGAIVFIGGIIYLARHGGEQASLGLFRGEPEDFRTVAGIIHSVLTLHGRGIIQFGLLILIATPVARVAFAAVGFALERDRLYAGVALLVLAFLLYSLIGSAGRSIPRNVRNPRSLIHAERLSAFPYFVSSR